MISEVNFTDKTSYWVQDGKWTGKFKVEWLFIKDIPNREFKSILIPTNENKPVTNTRDAQEIPYAQGMTMLSYFKKFNHDSSVLDEFEQYDKEESDKKAKKGPAVESFAKIGTESSGRGRYRQGRGRGRGRGRRGAPEGSHEGFHEEPQKAEVHAAVKTQPAVAAAAPAPNTNA